MTGTVLVLGANGKFGKHCALAFEAAGWEVRRFRRGTDMTEAAKGVDLIVNGLNPPNYHNWAKLIPEITAQVIAAARVSGATILIPGNVYVYGDTPGEWSEGTPHRPMTRKGRIREEMEQAYRASGLQVIVLRAGNFIDPQGEDLMRIMVLKQVSKGRITSPGDADAMQPWAWLPDMARAAVGLATKRHRLGQFEDVPFPGHAFTISQMKRALELQLGRPVRLGYFPWWALKLAAPFWEMARELGEMRYLFSLSHSLSGKRLLEVLPEFQPTPIEVVLRGSLPAEINPDQPVGAGRQAVRAE